MNQQIQVIVDLTNDQDIDQPFAYLVQIQDEDGFTVSLSWLAGSLTPHQNLKPAQSWVPKSPGTYNVQIFVWQSIDNPNALSSPLSTTIDVSSGGDGACGRGLQARAAPVAHRAEGI